MSYLFHDQDAFVDRLTEGLRQRSKEVVFVVGAPLTAPVRSGEPGVDNVEKIVGRICSLFPAKSSHSKKLHSAIKASTNPYQTAFTFLTGRRGQDAANAVVREAVLSAYCGAQQDEWRSKAAVLSDNDLLELEREIDAWHLTPAVEALGELIAYPNAPFGSQVITSNFDPLLEISIRKHNGIAWRTSLADDGDPLQSTAEGCHCIHIHGYWYAQDTLHTASQLTQLRPRLQNSLLESIKDKLVVVIAYGGWEDVFTQSLAGLISNSVLQPDILWANFSSERDLPDRLLSILGPGLNRNRVTLYQGIDCNSVLPLIRDFWTEVTPSPKCDLDAPSKNLSKSSSSSNSKLFALPSLECDRPPNLDVWVGREDELRALETSTARVVALCGIGGQGKSCLAAQYLTTLSENGSRFLGWDWRDCKEQGDRIRTQILAIIERVTNEEIRAAELSDHSDPELVAELIRAIDSRKIVLVFDNVDHHVDLETGQFTDILGTLVEQFERLDTGCRLIVTCRPTIRYSSTSIMTLKLTGISYLEAFELFNARSGKKLPPVQDIRDAHNISKGHVFWLDLLAVQVGRVPGATLRRLLEDIRRGRDDTPDILSSIWDTLPQREQLVLRFMAETARPETADTIEKFVASELNYQKFHRSLRSLTNLNLLVVKPEKNAPDLYDLHPLVRAFVRKKYEKAERNDFIKVVIDQYALIIGSFATLLSAALPFSILERWSQKAELEIESGRSADAIQTLADAKDALLGGGHVQEYVRTAKKILESQEWETAAVKYPSFDDLLRSTVEGVELLGDQSETDSLLSRYASSIPRKTARYINYCDTRAYILWLRKDFPKAEEWALKGIALKNETDVDTTFDCQHSLALIQRDAGQPEVAIDHFRKGHALSELTDPSLAKALSDGTMFGNVGRCLQFMGDLEGALFCYHRSINILENSTSSDKARNQTYAREWIGEILEKQGEFRIAKAFYVDAMTRLGMASPSWAATLEKRATDCLPDESTETFRADRRVRAWMRTSLA